MANCDHSWCQAGAAITPDQVIDNWLGPTQALIHCEKCKQPAVLYLLAWTGDRLARRLFAVSEVTPEAAETYLHNVSRDYCDLTRKGSETEALLQTMEIASVILAMSPDLVVEQAYSVESSSLTPKIIPWQDIDVADYDRWMASISAAVPQQ